MKRYIFIFLAIIASVFLSIRHGGRAEAIFFDVGQGDAYAFRTPSGKIILIDGGPDLNLLPELDRWLGYGNRGIEVLVLSHDHDDHSSALAEIAERHTVRQAFLPPQADSAEAVALIASLEEQGTRIDYPTRKECSQIEEDCILCILPPSSRFRQSTDLNDTSLAIYFDCAGLSVVGAGDAGKEREKEIAAEIDGKAKVMKASHHGSDTSNSPSLIRKMSPSIFVISVGESNSYGHPSKSVISRAGEEGARVWRTDISGALLIYAKNREIYYESWP